MNAFVYAESSGTIFEITSIWVSAIESRSSLRIGINGDSALFTTGYTNTTGETIQLADW